jgi:hypothetical protein
MNAQSHLVWEQIFQQALKEIAAKQQANSWTLPKAA